MTPSGSIPSGPPWSLSFELFKKTGYSQVSPRVNFDISSHVTRNRSDIENRRTKKKPGNYMSRSFLRCVIQALIKWFWKIQNPPTRHLMIKTQKLRQMSAGPGYAQSIWLHSPGLGARVEFHEQNSTTCRPRNSWLCNLEGLQASSHAHWGTFYLPI